MFRMTNEASGTRPWSLALRITLAVGLSVAMVFALSAWIVSRSVEQHFEDLDFGELQAVTESIARALGTLPRHDDEAALRDRLARAVAGHHGVYFGVFDARGRAIYVDAPQALLSMALAAAPRRSLERDSLASWAIGNDSFRGSVIDMHGERVLVTVSTNAHQHYLPHLRQGLFWGAVLATAMSVLAVCVSVRWGHAPLRRIGAAVREINSDQLHTRFEPAAVPAELSTFVASFNSMLGQLQASFERLSHFSADIAHELRTPVTNLMTQTQVALSKERPAAAYREILYTGLDELDRMRKMIGDMLFLAQTENPQRQLRTETVELDAEVRSVFDYFEAWSEEAGVELRLDGASAEPLCVRAHRGMLQRAVSNLVGNALRHTARGEVVVVRLLEERSAVRIEVENPGQEIGGEHLPHLFDRFYRVDPARQRTVEGAGLGLAIVRAIAQAHGGSAGIVSEEGRNMFWLSIPRR
ncbi:MAG: heavy metal sensor histidine kinase [Burkholderiales bacterium]|nr:heavy metal sensor histidine kinase [Burkholderiales bacterium]MDE2394947.1 heavy metal sensor histidine kinase [Burkholderiales bacterium]MDE2455246.1 heavy metal sensor histidine kinase [Burkholderiales bacterium]